MNNLRELIKKVLQERTKDCGCGCHGKCAKAPMLNENLSAKITMTEHMSYHIDNKKPLTENTFRYGSDAFLDLWAEARYLYSRNAIHLLGEDKKIVTETNLGEYGLFEGEMVPLDLPIMEEEKVEENIIDVDDKDEIFALISKVKQQGLLSDDAQRMLMQWMSHPDASKEAIVKVLKQLTGTLDEAKNTGMIHIGTDTKTDSDILFEPKTGTFYINVIDAAGNRTNKLQVNTIDDVLAKFKNRWKWTGAGETKFADSLDEAKEGKHVLNKPRRGGSKKFYVYVRNPKTKKIKKVSFGDTSGLSAKINNPEARRAFSKRHDCPNKTDKTKASYWSCRLPRYAKALGLKSNFTGFW